MALLAISYCSPGRVAMLRIWISSRSSISCQLPYARATPSRWATTVAFSKFEERSPRPRNREMIKHWDVHLLTKTSADHRHLPFFMLTMRFLAGRQTNGPHAKNEGGGDRHWFWSASARPVFNHLPDCEVVAIALEFGEGHGRRPTAGGGPRVWKLAGNARSGGIHILSIATLPGCNTRSPKGPWKIHRVILRKTLALNPDQSLELMTMAGKSLFPDVDFEFGEIPIWRECHRLLQSAAIGTLERLEVVWTTQTYANRNRPFPGRPITTRAEAPCFLSLPTPSIIWNGLPVLSRLYDAV